MTIGRAWIPWLLLGALVAGTLDISYAITFHYFRSGAPPIRILQSVASGLLGREAYQGGIASAALGLGLHFFNAMVATVVFFVAASRMPSLVRRPVQSGAAFGVGVYIVMNYVVVPLSRIGHPFRFVAVVAITGLLVHMFLIGVPIAWAASKAFGAASRSAAE
jgi:hypothetical protein